MKHSFLDKYSSLDSFIHKLDPRVKIITTLFFLIVVMTTSPIFLWAFLIYFLIELIILIISKIPINFVLKRFVIVLPFILFIIIFSPFISKNEYSGSYNLGILRNLSGEFYNINSVLVIVNVVLKSFLSIIALILLSSTTPFSQLLLGFRKLRVPSIFTNIASFMYRYVFIIVDEVQRMVRARNARNYRGKWILQSKVIGTMIANLFLRSYERGERVYLAMLSRGYNGDLILNYKYKIGWIDWLYLSIFSIILVLTMFFTR